MISMRIFVQNFCECVSEAVTLSSKVKVKSVSGVSLLYRTSKMEVVDLDAIKKKKSSLRSRQNWKSRCS